MPATPKVQSSVPPLARYIIQGIQPTWWGLLTKLAMQLMRAFWPLWVTILEYFSPDMQHCFKTDFPIWSYAHVFKWVNRWHGNNLKSCSRQKDCYLISRPHSISSQRCHLLIRPDSWPASQIPQTWPPLTSVSWSILSGLDFNDGHFLITMGW